MASKKWTDREIALLQKGLSVRELSIKLGRTEKSVYNKARRLGIELKKPVKVFNTAEVNKLKANLKVKDINELVAVFKGKFTAEQIRGKVRNLREILHCKAEYKLKPLKIYTAFFDIPLIRSNTDRDIFKLCMALSIKKQRDYKNRIPKCWVDDLANSAWLEVQIVINRKVKAGKPVSYMDIINTAKHGISREYINKFYIVKPYTTDKLLRNKELLDDIPFSDSYDTDKYENLQLVAEDACCCC